MDDNFFGKGKGSGFNDDLLHWLSSYPVGSSTREPKGQHIENYREFWVFMVLGPLAKPVRAQNPLYVFLSFFLVIVKLSFQASASNAGPSGFRLAFS